MRKRDRLLILAFLVMGLCGVLIFKQKEDSGRHSVSSMSGKQDSQSLPLLLDLGADKCVPCKMMMPVLETLEKEYAGQFEVKFIDVWKYPEKAAPYQIKLIPTQIFYNAEGQELFRHEGFYSKEDVLAKWKELGVDLTPSGEETNE